MTVLDVVRMNMNCEKAIRIGHNMPPAAVVAPARVVAARSADLGSRRTLASDHRRRRIWRASELLARPPDQNVDHPLPPARITPSIKVPPAPRIGRKKV